MQFSIVILTFNRPSDLSKTVRNLHALANQECEIIVVDNASEVPAENVLRDFDDVRVITESRNKGVGARNTGLRAARGDIIICLDDDVFDLQAHELERLNEIFSTRTNVAAVCFQVRDATTGEIMNWVHHRDPQVYSEQEFETYEITEGAVAFRASALRATRYYPDDFFISHEGPDLAFQLMDASFTVIYTPCVVVRHAHSEVSRESWRHYYYDTRNTFWLVARNLPLSMGILLVLRQVGGMLLFAIRDGNLKWWFKGVTDGLIGIRAAAADRHVLSDETLTRIRAIKRNHESLKSRWVRFRSGQVVGK